MIEERFPIHLQQVGEIIGRFERKGYQLVSMKFIQVSLEHAQQHYIDLKDKPFYEGLCKVNNLNHLFLVRIHFIESQSPMY